MKRYLYFLRNYSLITLLILDRFDGRRISYSSRNHSSELLVMSLCQLLVLVTTDHSLGNSGKRETSCSSANSLRNQMIKDWLNQCDSHEIPRSEVYDIQTILGDVVAIRDWNIKGLPADNVSINNGILVSRGRSSPLMIDPQSQANKWIKNMEEDHDLTVCKMDKIDKQLERSIPMGKPLLIEDIEEDLDPVLEPILMNQFEKIGTEKMIKVGDNSVRYDEGFRLYLSTKLANPHYLPEIFIKVTIINFTVTEFGLVQ